MKTFTKKVLCLAVVILIFFQGYIALAQTDVPQTDSTDVAANKPKGIVTRTDAVKPGEVEKAGENIGFQIDRFTQKAESHLGGWVNRKVIAGITWLKLIVCLLLLFLVALIERLVRVMIDRTKKVPPEESETIGIKVHVLSALAKPVSLFIWVNGIVFALTPIFIHFQRVDGSNLVQTAVQKGGDLGTAMAVIWFIFNLVSIVDARLVKWAAKSESSIDDLLVPLVGKTLRVFIIVIGGILVLQNLTGVEIGPLVASLGIGGLAVALAARDSIANFFGTLTILFDKPFQIGHRVVIDGNDGVVESVGFRSTRIRMLTGHLLTIPNEKIVNSFVENIGLRKKIRWLTNITITYDTPPHKVERAVTILKEILENHEGMHEDFPPRVYFNGFNDWSLNILVIAWYHPPNYWDMQAWLQRTCLEILRRFNEEGIEFAFPSRTVYMANDEKRQLQLKILNGETTPVSPGGEAPE